MINWKRNSVVSLIIFCSLFAKAQQFRYRSTPDSITHSGFYAIAITPELSTHLKADLSDFRVVNNKGQWIPHIIRYAPPAKMATSNVANLEFDYIQNGAPSSVLLIENTTNHLLANFFLRLKNAAAERMTSLSGSDDKKQWFIIADSLPLANSVSYGKDENTKNISFPATKYRYYKLTIRNDGRDPLNIVSVSAYDLGQEPSIAAAEENPSPRFSQRDSGKLSMITIKHEAPYQFDQIRLQVKRPVYYDRLVRMYLTVKPGILQTWETQPYEEFVVSSSAEINRAISLVKAKEFYILILNQDNPPLEISDVRTLQTVRQAVTYLEQGNRYHLLFDNPEAKAPEYDLNHFHANIPTQPALLSAGQIVPSETITERVSHTSGWWIWVSIGGITLLLAYLSWGLTRDMKKKSEAI